MPRGCPFLTCEMPRDPAQGIEREFVNEKLEDADTNEDGFLNFKDFLTSYARDRPVILNMVGRGGSWGLRVGGAALGAAGSGGVEGGLGQGPEGRGAGRKDGRRGKVGGEVACMDSWEWAFRLAMRTPVIHIHTPCLVVYPTAPTPHRHHHTTTCSWCCWHTRRRSGSSSTCPDWSCL